MEPCSEDCVNVFVPAGILALDFLMRVFVWHFGVRFLKRRFDFASAVGFSRCLKVSSRRDKYEIKFGQLEEI